MSKQSFQMLREVLVTTLLLYGAGGFVSVASAQVTSSGLNTTVNAAGGVFTITGGTRPNGGPNLFHSFGEFSLGPTEIGNFVNDSGLPTTNILSRVTGGNPSNIFGTIQTTGFPGANLFLMNPAGILFGPTAQLNVEGSFHATTADYIKLGNDGVFYADPAKPTLLSVAPPSAFGFLSANPAPIDVQAGSFDFNTFEFTPLQVPEGQTLSLVGGTLNLGAAEIRNAAGDVVEDAKPTFVLAPGGRINLVSVASAGEASFDGKSFNVDSFSQLGDINIKGGQIFGGGLMFPSYVDGKEVFIQGGQLVINNALIWPGFFSLFGLGPLPDGGEVNINVRGAVNITGTDVEPFLGNAPGIFTIAGSLFEPPEFFPNAKVPDVTINAGSLTIAGQASVQTARLGPGDPSNVVVNADTVTVQNGGSISLLNFYEGSGGALTINAREVNLSGDGTPSPTGITGLQAQNLFHLCFGCPVPPGQPNEGEPDFDPRLTLGDAASITVNATDRLTMSGDAAISTDSISFGKAGDITVNAKDMFLSGAGEFSGAISSQSALAGPSGNITINATGQIQINDGFRVTATSGSNGDGGTVNVSAGQSITMTGADSRILSTTAQLPDSTLDSIFLNWLGVDFATLRELTGNPNATMFDVLALLNDLGITNVTDLTPGNAGTINISTPLLTMNADTRIVASTGWDGNAGSVIGNFGSLFVQDGASIRSQSGIEQSGQLFLGAGNAGVVSLSANTITVSGRSPTSGEGSNISTQTFGDGDAGNIFLSANQVNIQNGGALTSTSGGTVNGQLVVGTGNAGQINVSTPTLTMADNGAISVATFGSGNAGDITLNVSNFTQTGGSRVDSSTSGGGSGGDLTVTATDSATLSDPGTGLFSTASSTGAGGDVNVQAPRVQILNGATISANSTGTETATAGNVNIATNDLNMQSSSITTEATVADGGNISITTTGSLVHLTDSQITTSVQSGVGSGGNIAINSDLIVLDDSKILANAFGGPGGNIDITADVFLVNTGGMIPTSLTGIVDASSALSTPGVINIEATFTNVVGSVTLLPETPLKATELLRAACAARFAGGKTSSLVVGGRDGVPMQPGGLLPSPLYMANAPGTPGTKVTGYDQSPRFSLVGSKDDPLLSQYSLLPNVKCAL
jgi:filamentous hemagglutinin family protein